MKRKPTPRIHDKEDLFVGFDAELESADGDEEIAIREQPIQHPKGDEESLIIGEGGSSSSSSTTMIRTKDGDIEWSATGRIGVSLAQLSGVREVSFAFKRAESRLASGDEWGAVGQTKEIDLHVKCILFMERLWRSSN